MRLSVSKLCIIILFFPLLFVSCKKQEVESNYDLTNTSQKLTFPGLKLENGYLVFENHETFRKIVDSLFQLNDDEQRNWEKSIGFNSLRGLLNRANAELDRATSLSNFNEVVDKNTNLFYLGPDSTFRLKNEKQRFSIILNEDGVVKIGSSLIKCLEENIVISTATNYKGLLAINNLADASKHTNSGLNLFKAKSKGVFNSSLSAAGPRSRGTNSYMLFWDRFESNDRRFFEEMNEEFFYDPLYDLNTGAYRGFVLDKLVYLKFGHQKKGAFGIWNKANYATYIEKLTVATGLRGYPYPYHSTIIHDVSNIVLSNGSNSQYYDIYRATENHVGMSEGDALQFVEPRMFFSYFYSKARQDFGNWFIKNYVTP